MEKYNKEVNLKTLCQENNIELKDCVRITCGDLFNYYYKHLEKVKNE